MRPSRPTAIRSRRTLAAEGHARCPDSLRWFWSLTVNGPLTRSDRVRDPGGSQGAVLEELGRLEGLGKAGRGELKKEATAVGGTGAQRAATVAVLRR